ncbi:MAG: DUF2071 domain-containing protein [Chloroflexi bacterium]|nr:DUF2071 domain-containing protein [Chloroflexota bacterium]
MRLIEDIAHRPYPLPTGAWVMKQEWHRLLFAHWALDPAQLQPLIPKGLTLDTFDGQAWISVVPFYMRGIRLRVTPTAPYLSAFAELNVRTYVTVNGDKPGVVFFSLDAANPIGVWLGRNWYHLPYFNADMQVQVDGDKVTYGSRRTHKNAPAGELRATYAPDSDVFHAEPGTLDHWLVERYCLYTTGRKGQIVRGDIHHVRWPVQRAKADITLNTVAPIPLTNTPDLVHYAHKIEVLAWPIKVV